MGVSLAVCVKTAPLVGKPEGTWEKEIKAAKQNIIGTVLLLIVP